jgi:serine/threonine protein kinase
MSPMMYQIGDQFDRFQIRSHIAQGGMADIYHARDLVHGREVVLKIPNRMLIGDPAQFERFQRELEITNTLQHPAIQRGLGSGQYNRTPYLVTEFVQGESMRDLVTRQTPMPPDQALSLMHKIADGIAYCHDHGVVHRDLKPENIIVTADGQPVIVDFGLALTPNARRVTYASLTPIAGTPDYMAPEQVEGQRGDKRTDIYAVGIMLHELLTGQIPLTGDTPAATMAQRVRGAVPRLDHDYPQMLPAVAAMVVRCLQRDPADRYPDMHALIYDMEHPDEVDLTILETGTGPQTARSSVWHSELFQGFLIAVIVIACIIIFALVGQGVAR